MRHALLATVAAIGISSTAATADVQVEVWPTALPAAALRLSLPDGIAEPYAVVVVVPDSLGADLRATPYLNRLASLGIATLEIEMPDDVDLRRPGGASTVEELTAATVQALSAALDDRRLDPGRIGLLGFGAGGRAILNGGWSHPAVALYPGCDFALNPAEGPVLLLHGAEEPSVAACAANVSPTAGGAVRAIPGVGAAWDAPVGAVLNAVTLWLHPSGNGRYAGRADPGATVASTEAAVEWLKRLAPRTASR